MAVGQLASNSRCIRYACNITEERNGKSVEGLSPVLLVSLYRNLSD